MREILFRGKTYDGKWEQGDLRHKGYVHNDSDTYIMRSDYALHNIPVDPETVGQYTGLTDKNGKKIFEGDIVRYGDTVHKVVFESRNETAYFGLVYSPLETLPFGHYQDLRQIEIIGNVHDNPELIGGESR